MTPDSNSHTNLSPIRLRAMTEDDLVYLSQVHKKYYEQEFSFPDFLKKFLHAFVAYDDGGIISAGGVRLIPEVLLITDKGRSVPDRRDALHHMLQASIFTAASYEFNEIHAFVQDDIWKRRLHKVGFRGTKGEALVFSF